MSLTAHIATASINQTVGDWTGNRRRISAAITEARRRGVRLLALPEMVIPGYSLGDRLLMSGTIRRSWKMLESLIGETAGMVVIIGLPVQLNDVLYNAAAVLADGKLVGIVPKENLATGDVQYENRWFAGWPHTRVESFTTLSGATVPFGGLIFEAKGLSKFAIEICEDGWKGIRPGSSYTLAGAVLLANPSASWFVLGKHRIRRQMVEQISREDHCVYLYNSLLGCDATRLVFDGSLFIAQGGDTLKEGRRLLFTEEIEMIDLVVDLEISQRARMEEGSWRQQCEAQLRGDFGAIPPTIHIPGDFTTAAPAPSPGPYWITQPPISPDPSLQWLVDDGLIKQFTPRDLPHLELELALALGLREYVKKCHIPGFALALSGGRDSSMCALLIGRMFRYDQPHLSETELKAYIRERFVCAYMGTDNSGSATRNAAAALSEELGAEHLDGAIQSTMDVHLDVFEQMTGTRLSWDEPSHDIPLQNVQARLRGGLIWMVANVRQFLLISTSNKSEAAVGYTTMDGDTSGGLSPISDVPKSLVTLWLRWATEYHGVKSLNHVIANPATAELRPPEDGQTDEDDLMPFFVLDQLMFHFVQLGQEPLDMFRALWPSLSDRYGGDAHAFAAHIRKFVRLVCFAQWKRERFAISFRVTAFDLDPKTGFRFPPVQAPFTEELAELDVYVAALN
ncbi:MAG: NAD+ synthase (glutamine-hydrolyzing) [Myxococcota bacterium]|jgi:NAD+ synthase (glutamine-hydrolysing)